MELRLFSKTSYIGGLFMRKNKGPVFTQDDDGNDVRDNNWDWHDTRTNHYGYNDKESNTTKWYEEDGSFDSSSTMLNKDDSDYYADVKDTYINESKR
jgi:hypothetical protein